MIYRAVAKDDGLFYLQCKDEDQDEWIDSCAHPSSTENEIRQRVRTFNGVKINPTVVRIIESN